MQAGSKQRAVQLRAGLDVQLVDAALCERAEHRGAGRLRPSASGRRDASRTPAGHAVDCVRRAVTSSHRRRRESRAEAAIRRCRSTIDAQRLARRRRHARTFSCGSSCSTVPMPVRIAQARARHAWPSARASPVIHWLSPSASAVRPSRLAAILRRTQGGRVHARDEADVELARLVREQPTSTCDAGGAQALARRRACAGFGSRIAATTRATPAPQQRVGARRRAAVVVARLERHVQRSRPRGSSPRCARIGKRVHFGVRPAGALRASPRR